MPAIHNIIFGGEQLVLRADCTLWWPRQSILFAADLHAGKAAHMRVHGLPIPAGNLQADLARLQQAAAEQGASRLIFLGDLFHSDINAEWDIFAAWCRLQPFTIELVRGNHDRFLSDALLHEAGVIPYEEPYTLSPFTLRHHPSAQPAEYELAGHIHPVCWLHGPAKDRLRVKCFWQHGTQLVLPAFGSFTGGYVVTKQSAYIYACAPDASAIITY